MKNLLYIFCMASIAICTSCNQESTFKESDLCDKYWVNDRVDNKDIETDQTFISEYRIDGKELYSVAVDDGKGGREWKTFSNNLFEFDGRYINLHSSDADEFYKSLKFEVLQLNSNRLKYSVMYRQEGESIIDDRSEYELYTPKHSYESFFTDTMIWEGKNTTPNTSYPEDARWEFHPDNTYTYYTLSGDKWLWINDNRYHLYGDVLVCEFSVRDTALCDVWKIQLTSTELGDSVKYEMNWSALRNGRENTVQMHTKKFAK